MKHTRIRLFDTNRARNGKDIKEMQQVVLCVDILKAANRPVGNQRQTIATGFERMKQFSRTRNQPGM